MKPTSPLSLLLFLRLASSAPILDKECHSRACIISLLTSPHSTHQAPPTHFTEPHFPAHQLADDLSPESPATTSSLHSSTESLSSNEPVSSNYLLSLSNPASSASIQHPPHQPSREEYTHSNENLPSKPSSALEELRAADLRKYWETLRPSPSPERHGRHSCSGERMSEGDRYYHQRIGSRRDYADLMVVGIVVLFLAVVVALEAVERCGSLSGIFCKTENQRGEIYLSDDENLFIVKRPFELSPAPVGSRSQSTHSEKSAFTYDSDAEQRA